MSALKIRFFHTHRLNSTQQQQLCVSDWSVSSPVSRPSHAPLCHMYPATPHTTLTHHAPSVRIINNTRQRNTGNSSPYGQDARDAGSRSLSPSPAGGRRCKVSASRALLRHTHQTHGIERPRRCTYTQGSSGYSRGKCHLRIGPRVGSVGSRAPWFLTLTDEGLGFRSEPRVTLFSQHCGTSRAPFRFPWLRSYFLARMR